LVDRLFAEQGNAQALPSRNRDQKDDRMGWEAYECFKEKEIAYGL
jgi:hypothetical protein